MFGWSSVWIAGDRHVGTAMRELHRYVYMYMNECKLIPLDQGSHEEFTRMTLPCQATTRSHLSNLLGMAQLQTQHSTASTTPVLLLPRPKTHGNYLHRCG